jgi:hypothetical protein
MKMINYMKIRVIGLQTHTITTMHQENHLPFAIFREKKKEKKKK